MTNSNNKPDNSLIILYLEKFKKLIAFEMDFASSAKERIANDFRWQAIDRVIRIIKALPYKITSTDQLKNIKGIGKGSLKRIDEILKTGKLLTKIKPSQEKYQKYVEQLQAIHGVGRRRALEWVTKYGVKSLDDLKRLYISGELDLPDSLLKTIKYHQLVQHHIPREEMAHIHDYLSNILLLIDPQLFGRICGSYRREQPFSKDVDFLMVHPDYTNIRQLKIGAITKNFLEIFVESLIEEKFIVHSLTDVNVDTLYMGYCRYENNPVRRIDIRFLPYDSYWTALLYFTGSRNFNIDMRKHAKRLGFHLSEYELTDPNGKVVHVNSEKDVFDALGLLYVDPPLRSI
jgi:DNA polymerase beta